MQEVNGVAYKVYPATKGGEFIGAAVEASSMGFGGDVTILVGFDAEGNIIDYSLLNHSETPGLGSKASDWFKKGNKGDIIGKNPGETPLTVINDGGDIDAITASTITSRAFLQAVNNAYSVYMKQGVDASSGASRQTDAPAETEDGENAAGVDSASGATLHAQPADGEDDGQKGGDL